MLVTPGSRRPCRTTRTPIGERLRHAAKGSPNDGRDVSNGRTDLLITVGRLAGIAWHASNASRGGALARQTRASTSSLPHYLRSQALHWGGAAGIRTPGLLIAKACPRELGSSPWALLVFHRVIGVSDASAAGGTGGARMSGKDAAHRPPPRGHPRHRTDVLTCRESGVR